MSVHGDDDLYADLYGNDDYAAVEDEILGTKPISAEKLDNSPTENIQSSSTSGSITNKLATPNQTDYTAAPRPIESVAEPARAPVQPPPQVGSSIATYTSDEGTTLPPTSYGDAYGSIPSAIRAYDPDAEKQTSYAQPNSVNHGNATPGGSPAGGYGNQSGDGAYQQKQGGYTNGAVYESSNQGGYQRGGPNSFGGGAQAGGRRFDSVRPSEMKDEG